MRLNVGLSYYLSVIAHGHLVTRVQLVLSLQCVKAMCARCYIRLVRYVSFVHVS